MDYQKVVNRLSGFKPEQFRIHIKVDEGTVFCHVCTHNLQKTYATITITESKEAFQLTGFDHSIKVGYPSVIPMALETADLHVQGIAQAVNMAKVLDHYMRGLWEL